MPPALPDKQEKTALCVEAAISGKDITVSSEFVAWRCRFYDQNVLQKRSH